MAKDTSLYQPCVDNLLSFNDSEDEENEDFLASSHIGCLKKCQEFQFDAIIYHSEEDREIAYKIKCFLENNITLHHRNTTHRPKLELVQNIRSSPYFEALETSCGVTKTIILVYTKKFENDPHTKEGVQAIWSLKPLIPDFEILPVVVGFSHKEKPALHVAIHSHYVRYEPRKDHFHDTMSKRIGRKLNFRLKHDQIRRRCEKQRQRRSMLAMPQERREDQLALSDLSDRAMNRLQHSTMGKKIVSLSDEFQQSSIVSYPSIRHNNDLSEFFQKNIPGQKELNIRNDNFFHDNETIVSLDKSVDSRFFSTSTTTGPLNDVSTKSLRSAEEGNADQNCQETSLFGEMSSVKTNFYIPDNTQMQSDFTVNKDSKTSLTGKKSYLSRFVLGNDEHLPAGDLEHGSSPAQALPLSRPDTKPSAQGFPSESNSFSSNTMQTALANTDVASVQISDVQAMYSGRRSSAPSLFSIASDKKLHPVKHFQVRQRSLLPDEQDYVQTGHVPNKEENRTSPYSKTLSKGDHDTENTISGHRRDVQTGRLFDPRADPDLSSKTRLDAVSDIPVFTDKYVLRDTDKFGFRDTEKYVLDNDKVGLRDTEKYGLRDTDKFGFRDTEKYRLGDTGVPPLPMPDRNGSFTKPIYSATQQLQTSDARKQYPIFSSMEQWATSERAQLSVGAFRLSPTDPPGIPFQKTIAPGLLEMVSNGRSTLGSRCSVVTNDVLPDMTVGDKGDKSSDSDKKSNKSTLVSPVD